MKNASDSDTHPINIAVNIPTLQELINEQNKQEYPYPSSPKQLQHVIDLLTEIPEFYIYSIQREWTPDFEIPYSVYWKLSDYIWDLYKEKNDDDIKKVLIYLDERLTFFFKTNDQYGVDLVRIGVLENFDRLTDLKDIIPLMPDWLRKDFIESFPQYIHK